MMDVVEKFTNSSIDITSIGKHKEVLCRAHTDIFRTSVQYVCSRGRKEGRNVQDFERCQRCPLGPARVKWWVGWVGGGWVIMDIWWGQMNALSI
jgi:hypothetical protein